MRIQRRADLKGARFAGEVPEANEAPVVAMHVRRGQFIAGDVEQRPLPAIGGLHLDQPIPPIRLEAGDVIARTIIIIPRDPAHLVGKIKAT